MVTTGIVRKIDDLGRIVLPKELRYNLNISSGDDFEILTENKDIILRKYSKVKNNEVEILNILEMFNSNIKFKLLLIVNNYVLGTEERILSNITKVIGERKIIKNMNSQKLTNNIEISQNNVIYPIVINSDLLGTIIATGNESLSYMEEICKIVYSLISNKIVE